MGRCSYLIVALLAAGPVTAECADKTVELKNPDGKIARFTIEVADTQAERALGLMGRQAMPAAKGMLFVYDHPQVVSFWMENTLIPLDMVFADSSGKVTKVHAKAKPLDRTPIPGGDDIQFVLEINGGLAAGLGISEGSVLRHPTVDPALALWACTD